MRCTKCKKDIPENATVCPICGFPVLEDDSYSADEDTVAETGKPVRRLHFGRPADDLDVTVPLDTSLGTDVENGDFFLDDNGTDETEDEGEFSLDDGAESPTDAESFEFSDDDPPVPPEKTEADVTDIPDENTAIPEPVTVVDDVAAVATPPVPKPPKAQPARVADKPQTTAKPVLGNQPLTSEGGDSSEELKRVLKTIFTPTAAAKPHSQATEPADKPHAGPSRLSSKNEKPASEEPAWTMNQEKAEPPAPPAATRPAPPTQTVRPASPPPLPQQKAAPPKRTEEPTWTLGERKATDPASRPSPSPIPEPPKTVPNTQPTAPEAPSWTPPTPMNAKKTTAAPKPVEADTEVETQEVHVTVGGFLRRLLAGLVDQAIVLLLTAGFMTVALWAFGSQRLPDLGSGGLGYLTALATNYPQMPVAYATLYVFLFALLSIFFSMTTGQTPGKMLFDLRMIQDDGEPLSGWRAIVRFVAYALSIAPFFMGVLWILADHSRQALHDKIAQTLVVRVNPKPKI